MKSKIKKILSITLPIFGIGSATTVTAPIIVSCSSSEPEKSSQQNIDTNYNIKGEFSAIYTKNLFDQNIALFKKWDGSNDLIII